MSIAIHHQTFIDDAFIDSLIKEDVPFLDLTTWILGIGETAGRIEFYSRDKAVLAGTEEAHRVLSRLGATTTQLLPSGSTVEPGQLFLAAEGPADGLHIAWKVSLNILEHASGIATRTRKLVDAVTAANPRASVVTTRKGFPGTKELAIKAVLAGGGLPHRLGLSETILIFEQHRSFLGDPAGFPARIQELKTKATEKKLLVEVDSLDQAKALALAGVDGVQFDKLSADETRTWVAALRAVNPRLIIISAGGVNESNAGAYAATGVDAIATSSVYFGKPSDFKVKLFPK
jgi:molybdenum transport protein